MARSSEIIESIKHLYEENDFINVSFSSKENPNGASITSEEPELDPLDGLGDSTEVTEELGVYLELLERSTGQKPCVRESIKDKKCRLSLFDLHQVPVDVKLSLSPTPHKQDTVEKTFQDIVASLEVGFDYDGISNFFPNGSEAVDKVIVKFVLTPVVDCDDCEIAKPTLKVSAETSLRFVDSNGCSEVNRDASDESEEWAPDSRVACDSADTVPTNSPSLEREHSSVSELSILSERSAELDKSDNDLASRRTFIYKSSDENVSEAERSFLSSEGLSSGRAFSSSLSSIRADLTSVDPNLGRDSSNRCFVKDDSLEKSSSRYVANTSELRSDESFKSAGTTQRSSTTDLSGSICSGSPLQFQSPVGRVEDPMEMTCIAHDLFPLPAESPSTGNFPISPLNFEATKLYSPMEVASPEPTFSPVLLVETKSYPKRMSNPVNQDGSVPRRFEETEGPCGFSRSNILRPKPEENIGKTRKTRSRFPLENLSESATENLENNHPIFDYVGLEGTFLDEYFISD